MNLRKDHYQLTLFNEFSLENWGDYGCSLQRRTSGGLLTKTLATSEVLVWLCCTGIVSTKLTKV